MFYDDHKKLCCWTVGSFAGFPTYSPTTLSVGFTGLALCSYTECWGLGGLVGLLWLHCACELRQRFLGLEILQLWKNHFYISLFSAVSFSDVEICCCDKLDYVLWWKYFSGNRLLEFHLLNWNRHLPRQRSVVHSQMFSWFFTVSCEIQLFHSSTGLIDLSAHPAHPISGGTLLFTLVVYYKRWLCTIWLLAVGKLLSDLFRCILFSMWDFHIRWSPLLHCVVQYPPYMWWLEFHRLWT